MASHHFHVALYARVSSEQQAKEDTIASQLDVIAQRLASDALQCDPELHFVDDGYSGSTLVRPGLERLRDQAAAGAIDRLHVLDPDRFSRKYAYQVLILGELIHCGVEVIFLCNPFGHDPAANLQVQGMIAEYERAKILERSRRGTPHAGVALKIGCDTLSIMQSRIRPFSCGRATMMMVMTIRSACSAARPTDTIRSANTRVPARHAIRSSPTRRG